MNPLVWLIPVALGMGLVGLAAFLWSMRAKQYEDLDGAAERVLLADAAEHPLRNEDQGRNDGNRPGTERAARSPRTQDARSRP